jgi:hypothetical protein
VLHLKFGCMARLGKGKESYCNEKRCLIYARGAGTGERGTEKESCCEEKRLPDVR